MNTSTRDTPVRYGRAYLSDEQWARQEAALNDAPKACMGPPSRGRWRAGACCAGKRRSTRCASWEMLNATGTVESYTLALQAEGAQAAGPHRQR